METKTNTYFKISSLYKVMIFDDQNQTYHFNRHFPRKAELASCPLILSLQSPLSWASSQYQQDTLDCTQPINHDENILRGSEAEVSTGWTPFLSPNQQHQSTEWKQITMPHITNTFCTRLHQHAKWKISNTTCTIALFSFIQTERINLTKLSLINKDHKFTKCLWLNCTVVPLSNIFLHFGVSVNRSVGIHRSAIIGHVL